MRAFSIAAHRSPTGASRRRECEQSTLLRAGADALTKVVTRASSDSREPFLACCASRAALFERCHRFYVEQRGFRPSWGASGLRVEV